MPQVTHATVCSKTVSGSARTTCARRKSAIREAGIGTQMVKGKCGSRNRHMDTETKAATMPQRQPQKQQLRKKSSTRSSRGANACAKQQQKH